MTPSNNDVDSRNLATYSRSEVDLLLNKQTEIFISKLTLKRDNTFKTALVALITSIVGLVIICIKG